MIDKLEFILALAREEHFGRAAEACDVSQPTLSAGIKQLEDTFGVLLVQRGSRFRGFTPEGERVLEWARRIVGDARAMRQEIDALKRGLAGHIRIAAIPTALAMTAMLTTPYRAKHPDVRFSILSHTSIQVLSLLENLEVDAGLTYLDNEPLGRVNTVPLYREEYRLLTSATGALGDRERSDLGRGRQGAAVPADPRHAEPAHHRRPAARGRSRAVADARIEFDDRAVRACANRQMGEHHAGQAGRDLGLTDSVRSIPIVEPAATHAIGLVVPHREPMTPLITALVAEARQLAQICSERPLDDLAASRRYQGIIRLIDSNPIVSDRKIVNQS